MTHFRRVLPIANAIFHIVISIALALMALDWALYIPGWINADLFVGGLSGSLCIFAGGVIVPAILLAAAPLLYRNEVR